MSSTKPANKLRIVAVSPLVGAAIASGTASSIVVMPLGETTLYGIANACI
ncbi:hypothetical protein [Ferrimonas lipolytica]|uniref:Uncharacterized protein n=1 Tax=Ferrimonas lipolytica TaxID=2724191 RepID=A0A6H1UJJ5_9GAMM|nr:hypothetical protein [Ferrimonas lipolytica]QIZ78483.1 hypothetical protein HER31_17210 [Ferrimonas lipolytica]